MAICKSVFILLFILTYSTILASSNKLKGVGSKLFKIFQTVTETLKEKIKYFKDTVFAIKNVGYAEIVNKSIIKEADNIISFIHYTRDTPEGVTSRCTTYNETDFDFTKTTKMLIHGWKNNQTSGMPQVLRKEYLKAGDYNVVIVDWGLIANETYPVSAFGTSAVAKCVAQFILLRYHNVAQGDLDIHIIGHSLGAHVSGYTGRLLKMTNYTINRITGLDPAGPLIIKGLSKDDALFVDVIHTTAGFLGKSKPIGHVDFYPNGGKYPQPGCFGLMKSITCSHSKSWQYFAESINSSKKYVGFKCESYTDYMIHNCTNTTYLGEYISHDSRGVFYLNISNVTKQTI